MRNLVVGLLALLAGGQLVAQNRPVVQVMVSGTIELGLAPYIQRSLRQAEEQQARAVILILDTPGGRIDAAERIADDIRDARVPVYAFVDRRAFSAGALIALATDSIFMRPGSVIGAATPVNGQTGEKLPEKYVSAMRGEFRALAEEYGIDPRLAEGMVDEAIEIPGVKPAGQLLTLSTTEALQHGVARAMVADFAALIRLLELNDAPVVATRVNWAEGLVRFVSNPIIASLLITLGMVGLIAEVKTPGFGVAGITGLLCIALFFGSHWIIGLAGWLEVILILGGIAAVLVEIFVLPGFGVAGVAGILSVGTGFALTMIGPYPTGADIWQILIGAGIGVLVFVLVGFLRHLPSSRRFAGILHDDTQRQDAGYVSAPIRPELVGRKGVALSELRPVGVADVDGERLDVTTEGEWLPAGTPLSVIKAEAMRLVVKRLDQLTA
jgi:membrane-bound serine protease (ClpP class)